MPMPRLRIRRRRLTVITRADRARAAGEWQLAAGLYRVALERTPNRPPIWIQYGHALKESGSPAEAENAYRIAIAYKPADADAHLQLGHALKLQGKRGEAEAAYRQAWVLDRSSAEAARELAAFGWTRQRLAEAVDRSAAAPARDDPPATPAINGAVPHFGGRRGKEGLITRADRAQSARQWLLAARLYRKALDRNPDNPPIWVQYGHALKESGMAEAERAYRAALSYASGVADTHLQLGHVLKLQGKTEEAEAAYLRALALDVSLAAAAHELANLGWTKEHLSAMEIATGDGQALRVGVVGSLDGVQGTDATGWVWDPRAPASCAMVEFLVDGMVVHRAQGKIYRDDVRRDGFGTGYAGFEATLPIRVGENGVAVHARLAGTNWALENSPKIARQPLAITNWMNRSERVTAEFRLRLQARLDREAKGVLSIIMPVYNTNAEWLLEAIGSVTSQWCSHWELVCVNNGSTQAHVGEILDEYARSDNRIKVVTLSKNAGIAGGTNAGINASSGELIAFMDSDDYLEPDAVYKYLRAYQTTKADLLYCDELLTGSDINFVRSVAARPAYSWDYYMAHPYFVHMICISRKLLDSVKGWNELMEVSGDVDFVLRCQEQAELIAHIPSVLYRWRIHATSSGHQMQEYVTEATISALNRHLARIAPGAVATAGYGYNFYRIDFPDDHEKVLVVIPTRNRIDLLKRCLDSIFATTVSSEVDIIVIDHDSNEPESVEYIESIRDKVIIVPYKGVFNYAKMNNEAVNFYKNQRGGLPPYVAFLNNDIEAIEPGWLEHMRGLARRDDVGVVGATLLYPDDTIQHSGVVIGLVGPAEHANKFLPFKSGNDRTPGHLGSLVCTREYSAVTAACMMSRSSVFTEARGFDEQLAVGFNDTDYCLRVGSLGYKILNDAHAVLRHYESATRSKRGQLLHPEDNELFVRRWREIIDDGDPYYSPLFSRAVDRRIERYANASAKVAVKPSPKECRGSEPRRWGDTHHAYQAKSGPDSELPAVETAASPAKRRR
jgi:GT2 family glycosyltransferase/tetratricopeptide (TPR) repeat protein